MIRYYHIKLIYYGITFAIRAIYPSVTTLLFIYSFITRFDYMILIYYGIWLIDCCLQTNVKVQWQLIDRVTRSPITCFTLPAKIA